MREFYFFAVYIHFGKGQIHIVYHAEHARKARKRSLPEREYSLLFRRKYMLFTAANFAEHVLIGGKLGVVHIRRKRNLVELSQLGSYERLVSRVVHIHILRTAEQPETRFVRTVFVVF